MKRIKIPSSEVIESAQYLIYLLNSEDGEFGLATPEQTVMPLDPSRCQLVIEPAGYVLTIPAAPPFNDGLTLVLGEAQSQVPNAYVACISTEKRDTWAIVGKAVAELAINYPKIHEMLQRLTYLIQASAFEDEGTWVLRKYTRPVVGLAHAGHAPHDSTQALIARTFDIPRTFGDSKPDVSVTSFPASGFEWFGDLPVDACQAEEFVSDIFNLGALSKGFSTNQARRRSGFHSQQAAARAPRRMDGSGNTIHPFGTVERAGGQREQVKPRPEQLPTHYNLVGGASFSNLPPNSGLFVTGDQYAPILILKAPLKHQLRGTGMAVDKSLNVRVVNEIPNAMNIATVIPAEIAEIISRCGKRFGKDLFTLTGFDVEMPTASSDILIADLVPVAPFHKIVRMSHGPFAPGNTALMFGFSGSSSTMTLLVPMRNDDIAINDPRFPLQGEINLDEAKGAYNWLLQVGEALLELPTYARMPEGPTVGNHVHQGVRPGYNPPPAPKTEDELEAEAIKRERGNRPAPSERFRMNPNTKRSR